MNSPRSMVLGVQLTEHMHEPTLLQPITQRFKKVTERVMAI